MLLAIDIGNTNLVIGCIENDKILFKARIATDATRTSDQYGVEIKNMMEAFGVQVKDIDDCIISSVVPPVFNSVKTGVIKVIRKQPMVVGPGLKTGLNIHMEKKRQKKKENTKNTLFWTTRLYFCLSCMMQIP